MDTFRSSRYAGTGRILSAIRISNGIGSLWKIFLDLYFEKFMFPNKKIIVLYLPKVVEEKGQSDR